PAADAQAKDIIRIPGDRAEAGQAFRSEIGLDHRDDERQWRGAEQASTGLEEDVVRAPEIEETGEPLDRLAGRRCEAELLAELLIIIVAAIIVEAIERRLVAVEVEDIMVVAIGRDRGQIDAAEVDIQLCANAFVDA